MSETTAVDLPEAAPDVQPVQGVAPLDPAQHYVVPISVMNQIAEYLLERPWREVNHLVRALEGTPTLDELTGR